MRSTANANFAMSPMNANVGQMRNSGMLAKSGIKGNVGPFYSPRQAEEWSKELAERGSGKHKELSVYDPVKHPELYQQPDWLKHKASVHKHAEYERHKGGPGALGPTDDRLNVRQSVLSGSMSGHTPRFLETFPSKPKSNLSDAAKDAQSSNVLELGMMPNPPGPKKVLQSLNYNPIRHEYNGPPILNTAMQRRAAKERTGYVTIAGGRKDLAPEARKTEALADHIGPYIDGRYIRADPVHIWLKDEQMEAVGGLRTFPTQKGVSPLTRRLIQADRVRLTDSQVTNEQKEARSKALTNERIAIASERHLQYERKQNLAKTQFTIKDAYTDHQWGVNYGRSAVRPKGYDRIHHRHKDDADEKQLRQREMQKMKEKSDRGRQRQLQLESDYNIIELKDKQSGQEVLDSRIPMTGTKLVPEKEKAIAIQRQAMEGLMKHSHSADDGNVDLDEFYRTSHQHHFKDNSLPRVDTQNADEIAASREKEENAYRQFGRMGVHSGVQNEQMLRYQQDQDVVHTTEHTSTEAQRRNDADLNAHGANNLDSYMRYEAGAVHEAGPSHRFDEAAMREDADLNSRGANQSGKLMRFEPGMVSSMGPSRRTEETGETAGVWNYGEEFSKMESRSSVPARMQRELATDIGGNAEDHVSLRKQREKHAKLTASVGKGQEYKALAKGKPAETSWFTGTSGRHTTQQVTDETAGKAVTPTTANNSEGFMRFHHADLNRDYETTSWGHTVDESDEKVQFFIRQFERGAK